MCSNGPYSDVVPRGEWIPDPIRRRLVTTFNRWLAFRAARAVTVSNVALTNDLAAFEQIYGSPRLVAEYLGPERLAFYERVGEFCVGFQAASVVDVGCGTGHLLAVFARQLPNAQLVGVDNSPAAIALLRDTVPTAEGVVGDVYDVSVGRTFDLVLCTEVLEHLDRPDEALNQLLTLGPRVVVTVPDGQLDTYEGHVNFWTIDQFQALLDRHGYALVERLDAETLVGTLTVAQVDSD